MEENVDLLVEEEEEEVQIPQDNENALIQEPDPAVIEGDILTQREGEVPPEEPRELPDQYDLGHQGEYSEEVSPLVPAKTVDEAARENKYLKQDFTNLLRKISEHPNGAKYADKLIYNILHEEQDFGEGGKYENIKVTEVLENFEEIFPDVTDTEDVSNGLTRNVSPVADTLKEFLRDRKNRENYPVLYALQDSFEGTVEAGKELAWTAPNRIGYALMETLAGVAEWGTGDFVKAYWMSEGLSKKEAEKRKKEFYDISGYGLQADRPQTVLGQLAVSGGEAGLAYFTGKRIYESIAVPIKNIVPKIAEMLATPGGKIAISEVIGGTLITSREERLAPVLQMLGVTGRGPFGNWVDYIAGSEDDSVFEERFKSFIDATYTGVGLGLVAPLIMLTGKGAYHAAKGTTEQGRKALQAGASWADQIFHNYPVEEAMRMDLGGPKVIKTEELGRIRDQAEELLLQQDTVEKTVGTGKKLLKKVGVNTGEEKRTVKELLESQGHKIDDDTIQPVIKHETESFLQPIADVDFDEVILDSVSGIDGAIDFEDISKTVFNLKYVSGENRKQAIAEASVLFQKRLEKLKKTHGSSIVDAQKIRADIEHMVGPDHVDTYLMEIAGTTDALPGTMLALKQYMIEESLPFMMSSKAVAAQAKQLADGTIRTMDKKLLAQYFLDTYRLMGVLEADVKLIGNVARTLEARKIALGGSDELLDNIIAGAKDGSLEGEDLLINIAQTVDKYTDVTQVLNGGRPKGKLYTLFDGLKSWAVSGLLSGIKTLAAAPVGISTYMAVKSGETWVAAGLNQTGKLLYKTTGSKILGTGDGVTFSQANAYHFGMAQALLEVFGGTGYFKRSAFGEGTRVGRTLDLGDRASTHEMIKMFEGSKEKINVPILGEFTMAKGVNGQALDNLLGLTEHGLTGHGPKFLKFLANSAGFINGLNARIIMAEDGFFRTLLERAEMHKLSIRRAEERLRSAGKEFSHEDLMNEYFHVVKNYPEDLARIGKAEAKIGVMQETKRGGLVSTIETAKNKVSNSPKIGQNIGSNLLRIYLASKFSFIRTMANIYKQTLTERGIGKIAKTYFNEKEARRFANDPAFKQESLAKMGSGLLVVGMGGGLGWGLLKNDDTEIYMEGVDASIRGKEYIKMSQGSSFGPEIKMRNVKTGQITSIPLERLDMGKAPLVLGAIAASSFKQAQEAFAKMPEGRALDGLRELEELTYKFGLALGDMMTDLPMAQGAQETLKNLIPGFGPEWNPGKEGTSFFHGFFNPIKSGLSTLRSQYKKGVSAGGVRFQKYKDQKWELNPLEDWENQQYTTKGHTEEYVGVPEVGRKLGIVSDILLQLQDIGNRVSIGDYSDPENPIIGQDLYAMVDPEGNLMRYLPDPYIDKIRRAAETLLIPFSPHTLAQTNTTDLIAAFDHPYEHPKDWSTGSNYPLSAEQRYHWTVLAGRANKKTFSDPYWKDVILKERLGFYDPDTREGRAERGTVLRELELDLEQNRMEALEEMLSLERNRAASDYIEAARLQLPPLHAKDKL